MLLIIIIYREVIVLPYNQSYKRYHYFLAEYSRLEFAKERRLFEGRDWLDAVNVIVENCFNHFQGFMTDPNHQSYPVEIKDMRNKLSRWRFCQEKNCLLNIINDYVR